MKRHQCRHCGLAFDTCTELQRHVQINHSTPSCGLHSYSVAPPIVTPPNDYAKRTKYACEKCGTTFGRLDNLQRHVRSVCSSSSSSRRRRNITVYTCKKCERKFERRWLLVRHTRTVCTDVTEPPPTKRSTREDTTPSYHPLVTEEDLLDPPDQLPFADTLSAELLDVVRAHWSGIRTHTSRGPLQCRYNYRLTTLDTTVLEPSLKIMFQEQTNAFKINLSYGFVLRNKNTGQYKYYHTSCNCCGRYLNEPSLVTNRKDFDVFLERIREPDDLQWAINQRPDSAWVCELVTNVTFFVNRIIDHPIGCVGMISLPTYIKKKKSIIGLETEPNHNKRYNDNLCLFRCLALHRGCDLYRMEPSVKTLYETYDRDHVPMEEFAGVTLDDLYRVETTFQTNVCVYQLVKPDAEDGKSTAELVRRSLCKYPETMYLNLHETHFSFIQDTRMYCNSYRCRKCGDSLWKEA